MHDDVGDVFQKGTKYTREQLFNRSLDCSKKPAAYKTYASNKIPLSLDFNVKSKACMPLIEVLRKRRSFRSFSDKPLRIPELAFLLWASTGIRKDESNYEFRTAPSAGALYPIETYTIVNNVEGLQKGLYHYDIKGNSLEEVKTGDFGEKLSKSALGQEMCTEAPVALIWTAIFARSKWKYMQRAYRYVYLDSGHIAQNLALSATSLDLGSCQIAAFFDDEINKILDLDGTEESAVYLSVVGHPA